jgi:heparosan-N-sulfate-glucuronate 5-epimerase
MAQGVALSALARAYSREPTTDLKLAGDAALRFLLVPISEGGTFTTLEQLDPSLANYIFFEEYVTSPNVYTLNGYMFTLLGIYDWWKATESPLAERLFSKGMSTLVKLLPYYDIAGFSIYDLSFLTHDRPPHSAIRYHAVHISQLHALHSVTGRRILKEYADRWAETVQQ